MTTVMTVLKSEAEIQLLRKTLKENSMEDVFTKYTVRSDQNPAIERLFDSEAEALAYFNLLVDRFSQEKAE